ncbi:Uncharacterised protein [uncultured archaeon]|nr:Uncharacterised protein [uncultured archaeon]
MHLNNNCNGDYYEMTCLLGGVPVIKSSPAFLSLLAEGVTKINAVNKQKMLLERTHPRLNLSLRPSVRREKISKIISLLFISPGAGYFSELPDLSSKTLGDVSTFDKDDRAGGDNNTSDVLRFANATVVTFSTFPATLAST